MPSPRPRAEKLPTASSAPGRLLRRRLPWPGLALLRLLLVPLRSADARRRNMVVRRIGPLLARRSEHICFETHHNGMTFSSRYGNPDRPPLSLTVHPLHDAGHLGALATLGYSSGPTTSTLDAPFGEFPNCPHDTSIQGGHTGLCTQVIA